MNIYEIKEWAEEHKKEVIVGGVSLAVMVAGAVILKRSLNAPVKASMIVDSELLKLGLEVVDDVDSCVTVMSKPKCTVPLSALGKVGDAILKNVDCVVDEPMAYVLISVGKE